MKYAHGYRLGNKVAVSAKKLLDDIANIEYAYSLRYLLSSYTGPVIRGWKSGPSEQDFTPSQLTDGTLTAFASGGDVLITTIYDQSGNGRHATQNTSANMPRIVNAGTLVTMPDNGLPAVDFFGSGTLGWETGSFTVNQPATKFVIGHSNTTLANQVWSRSINDAARHQVYYDIANGGEGRMFSGSALINAVTTGLLNSTWLMYAMFNGGSSQIGINGDAVTTGNAGTQSNDGYRVPTTAGPRGYWQEDIYLSGNRSSERATIEADILAYYSIS